MSLIVLVLTSWNCYITHIFSMQHKAEYKNFYIFSAVKILKAESKATNTHKGSFLLTHLNTHRDSVGSTGPCVRRAPCSWQPDSAERNTEWCRCCRCSWCRRWLSRSLPPAARPRRWLCSTPAGCCSLAARGSASRLWSHTGISRVDDENTQRLRQDMGLCARSRSSLFPH